MQAGRNQTGITVRIFPLSDVAVQNHFGTKRLVATLFRLVACFARVRIEDYSRNRFTLNGIQRDVFGGIFSRGILSGYRVHHIRITYNVWEYISIYALNPLTFIWEYIIYIYIIHIMCGNIYL